MSRLIRISPERLPASFAARWDGTIPCLWALGNLTLVSKPLAAVIGTRRPSRRGMEAANAWAQAIAGSGAVVLSGGAVGIDLEAHRASLACGGATILVPARGLNRYGPPVSILEYANSENCLLLSNLDPDEPGSRSSPVRRNALVAALADVVLVIESPHRGGTAHVVNRMRRRGGLVMAVDYGKEASATSAGNHALLLAGATGVAEDPTRRAVARLRDSLEKAHASRSHALHQSDFFENSTPPPP